MSDLRIEVSRGDLVESVHRVSAAVVDSVGRLLAWAGDPDLVTFWRSAAKPFQAIPLVEDGVLERYELGSEELALACSSHSSEPVHLALADRFLARIGCTEDDLACGPHPPLGPAVAKDVTERGIPLTPRWSNCSGKHAGMLALARLHGWPTSGYQTAGHPVQERILEVVSQWTGMSRDRLHLGIDGCTAANFGLPLRSMALAYARLADSREAAAVAVREAMVRHPDLVAGEKRFCTDLMRAMGGTVLAKIGAGGIYCAALVNAGIGIALKIEDGDMQSAPIALLAALRQLFARGTVGGHRVPDSIIDAWAELPVHSTRGAVVGAMRSTGSLRFFGAPT